MCFLAQWTSPLVFIMFLSMKTIKSTLLFPLLSDSMSTIDSLRNSPASFMRMMLKIFGDQNFMSLLCYLDDLMIFAPSEELALERIEMIFQRLRLHNLKLAPKKCFLLRRSVRFLGHVINNQGISTDPSKVEAVTSVTRANLMRADGLTPDAKKIQSFLGLVMWYQRFI